MARNGKDAFAILADYFSRLVQSMISDIVRMQAYKWFWNLFGAGAPSDVGYTTPSTYGGGNGVGFNGPMQSRAPVVNIIDQRIAGSPALSAQAGAGAGGSQVIEVVVSDAITSMYNNGKLDRVMKNYGASRMVTVG
jgi:hypothetical protein